MQQTSTKKILPLLIMMLFASIVLWGQTTPYKRPSCSQKKQPSKITSTTKTEKKKVNIELPKDYEPPVAKDEHYQFPETFAQTKKLKRLRKRHKRKKKGCIAANM